jgi:8-oxo-dGTP pyrophosphatase MutT (NUDIX family)
MALLFSPTVACKGVIVPFGQCLHHLVGSGKLGSIQVQIIWSVENGILHINNHDTAGENDVVVELIDFEHAKPCPAQELQLLGWIPPSLATKSTIRIGVAVIIEDLTGKILLTKRNANLRAFPNVWVVPGGHIEKNETLEQAGAREAFEEVGLLLDPTQLILLGLWESTFPHLPSLEKPITHHHAVVYLFTKLTSPITILSVQASEVGEVTLLSPLNVKDMITRSDLTSVSVIRVLPSKPIRENEKNNWEEKTTISMMTIFESSMTSNKESVSEIRDNMTAGTHFSLRKWLEKKIVNNGVADL